MELLFRFTRFHAAFIQQVRRNPSCSATLNRHTCGRTENPPENVRDYHVSMPLRVSKGAEFDSSRLLCIRTSVWSPLMGSMRLRKLYSIPAFVALPDVCLQPFVMSE